MDEETTDKIKQARAFISNIFEDVEAHVYIMFCESLFEQAVIGILPDKGERATYKEMLISRIREWGNDDARRERKAI